MTDFILSLHSIIRWVVVILAVITVGRALIGWRTGQAWTQLDDRLGLFFTIGLDIQVLVGFIVLFFFSPTLSVAANMSFGEVMGNAALRFAAIEHPLLMLIALVIAHVGRSRAKQAEAATQKHKQAAIFFGVALIVVLIAVPWPFLHDQYPWLRLGATKL